MSEGTKGRAWRLNRADFDRNLAVVIGIDRYRNDSIRDLSTAVSDARAIADLLEQKYDYKQSAEKPEVVCLFDEEANLKALQHLFHTRILEELKPGEGDRLVIYFAGHGLPRSNDDGPEGYLVPHDADPTEPTSFLAMRDVSEALDKLECHHLLVILDCCFAGTFRWAGSRKALPLLETIHQEHYYHFIRHPAWQVITSSAYDQEALDVARLKEDNRQPVANKSGSPFANEPHSPFALALLEGLYPGDGSQRVKADLFPDGVVTAHELFVYLQTRVKQLSGERQAPGIYPLRRDYDKGEFVFTPPEFKPEDLAKAPPLNEENNPYRGLKSFDEKHARFFFGRQALIKELAKRLAEPDQTLTVVLGVSGSGKSSLVKAGLIPHLRDQKPPQKTDLWRILEPMRPGESPFVSLARTLLPIADESLLEGLAEVSFLDAELQPDAESYRSSVDETLRKVADSWCSAKPEAKLLLIEDYYAQLEPLGNSQQESQLKNLYDQILKKLGSVSQQLQNEPKYFSQLIATWHQNHPGIQLLLVIDQFEELLTRSQDERESSNQSDQQGNRSTDQKEWQKFLGRLRIAIADHPQTLRLVLTLRSDFEPRFLSSALEPYWKDARFPVRAMNSDELRQAIENPALKQALYFEELKDEKGNTVGNLVSELVDEVGQMPGALPLLSFTLSELYVGLYKRWQQDKSTDRTLRFADYKVLGGVAGALTRRATEECEALDDKHQATMQRVMLRMVAIEGGGVVRRRVSKFELVYSDHEENERVEQVIQRLVEARLLVTGQEAVSRTAGKEIIEGYVEPAHDFLVNGWNKLQIWIKGEQEQLVLRQRLNVAANAWIQREGSLWIEEADRLIKLNEIINSSSSWLNRLETVFVKRSGKARQDRIKKLEEDLQISEQRRTRAEIREKSIRANNLLKGNPTGALVLAIYTLGQNLEELPKEIILSAKSTLLDVVRNAREENIIDHNVAIKDFVVSSDGRLISIHKDGSIKIRDLKKKIGFSSFQAFKDEPACMAISPNNIILALGFEDGVIRLLELQEQTVKGISEEPKLSTFFNLFTRQKRLKENTFKGHQERINSLVFSPDNQVIASSSNDGTIRLWNFMGEELKVFYAWEPVYSVAFSSDGSTILSGCRSGIKLWNFEGELIEEHQVQIGVNSSSAFSFASSSGGIQALVAGIFEIYIKDLTSNSLKTIKTSNRLIHSAAFNPDGTTVVCGNQDGVITLWNLRYSDTSPQRLIGHDYEIRKLAFFEEFLISRDSKIRIWSLKDDFCETTFETKSSSIYKVFFGFDDKTLISNSGIWDKQGKPLYRWHDKSDSEEVVYQCVYSPNENNVATIGPRGIRFWNLQGYPISQHCQSPLASPYSHSFSPDGNILAVGCNNGEIHIWSLDGSLVSRLIHDSNKGLQVSHVIFSSDSRCIVSLNNKGYVQIWEQENLTDKVFRYRRAFKCQNGGIEVTLSPCDKFIAIGSISGSIQLWDIQGNPITLPFKSQKSEVRAIAFCPGSEVLATSSGLDIQLWSIEGDPIGQPFLSSTSVRSLAFSSDGKYLVCGGGSTEKGIIQLWRIGNFRNWLELACHRLRYHPIFTDPQTEIEKAACLTCQKYVWRSGGLEQV